METNVVWIDSLDMSSIYQVSISTAVVAKSTYLLNMRKTGYPERNNCVASSAKIRIGFPGGRW